MTSRKEYNKNSAYIGTIVQLYTLSTGRSTPDILTARTDYFYHTLYNNLFTVREI